MTPLVRVRRGPGPWWIHPATGARVRLCEGDVVTFRRWGRPWTFTVRTWGTSPTGKPYVAGAFWSCHTTDITTTQRQGDTL